MKVPVRKTVFLVLALLWMGVIFFLSSRDAETSTRESYYIGMQIGSVLHADFHEWTEEEQLAYAERIDHPVRKGAHMFEYLVLGMLLTGALLPAGTSGAAGTLPPEDPARGGAAPPGSEPAPGAARSIFPRTGGKALLIAALYSVTDEFHQRFVPGRSCQLSDMLLDSCGAAIGILLVLFILSRTFSLYNESRAVRH